MQRREFLKIASAAIGTVGVPLRAAADTSEIEAGWLKPETSQGIPAVTQPNIIFIVSDQHRTGLRRGEGYSLDTGPAVDRLAASGVSFDRAYCTAPLCVPSRTSMLTGRWPEAHHVRSNDMIREAYYPTHLYQLAKEHGYRTGLTGKNHTFLKPSDLDFWREYELAKGWMPPDAPESYRAFDRWMQGLHANVGMEATPFPLELQYPYRIVSDAMEFIDAAGAQPFVLQVGFSEPHDPEQVPAPYWDMFPPDKVPPRCSGPEALEKMGYRAQWEYGHQEAGFQTEAVWRRYKSNYLGMLRLIDDQVARLMAFLEKKSLTEKTLIIFTADHGDYLMDYGLARKGVGLYECLSRIPMVWSGPGIRPSRVGASACVSMADFFPTLCEAMGLDIPHGVQGRSLWPLLQGEAYPAEEFRSAYVTVGLGGLYYEASDEVPYVLPDGPRASAEARAHPLGQGFDELNKVTLSGLAKMVRMGDWKLVYDMMGYGQLYNLAEDPCELKNVFNQPHVAAHQNALMAELLMWTIRAQDSLPTGPQNVKYTTKWPAKHNWYAPHRHGVAPAAFIP